MKKKVTVASPFKKIRHQFSHLILCDKWRANMDELLSIWSLTFADVDAAQAINITRQHC